MENYAAEQDSSATRLSRSSLLEGYLSSITELLQEGRFDDAERSALALPHIAVALTDAQLYSSAEDYRAWCAEWVGTEHANGEYGEWSGKAAFGEDRAARGIPSNALRALRLHRHSRPNSGGIAVSHEVIEQDESPVTTTCLTLMAATLRWYSRSAATLPQVQANLARLGVLH